MNLFTFFLLVLSLTSGYSMASEQKIIYGYVEKATLLDKSITLSAKFDTGAKSASLSAINIHKIEKNGKFYICFKVPSKNGEVDFISEYLGKVKIKVRAGENISPESKMNSIKRSVVMMQIKIGEKERTIPVNLTNRKRFNYPLLLGRDAIIAFNGIVDPDLKFTLKTKKANSDDIK